MLELIARRLERGEPSPTIRELLDDSGRTSTNGMRDHLRALRRKGLVDFIDYQHRRALRITTAGWRALGYTGKLSCPCCGVPLNLEKLRAA